MLAAAVSLGGCQPPPSIDQPAATPPAIVKPTLTAQEQTALEALVLARIAELRSRETPQSPPLNEDPSLREIARARSQALAGEPNAQGAAHFSADLLMDRQKDFQGVLGECAAILPVSSVGAIDPQNATERILGIWRDSPKHWDNLTFPGYRIAGVGIVLSNNALYVTTLMAADLDSLTKPHKN